MSSSRDASREDVCVCEETVQSTLQVRLVMHPNRRKAWRITASRLDASDILGRTGFQIVQLPVQNSDFPGTGFTKHAPLFRPIHLHRHHLEG